MSRAFFCLVMMARPSSAWTAANGMPNRRRFVVKGSLATAASILTGSKVAFAAKTPSPVVFCDESVMSKKAHGTTAAAVQPNLLFNVNHDEADRICSFNRHFAEPAGSFKRGPFVSIMNATPDEPRTFYDSVTGLPLFKAPIGRTTSEFLSESNKHGWPSFRDNEVIWENVRVLKSSGETVALSGTHLGHNLPDFSGNRYCINLCCIAGNPLTIS